MNCKNKPKVVGIAECRIKTGRRRSNGLVVNAHSLGRPDKQT